MSLLLYIQGRRRGKEAHRIEREAMQYPFLSEALDGYDTVAGDHANAIRRMQEQLKPQPQAGSRNTFLWTGIAASVLLFLGIGWYLLIRETPQTIVISEAIPAGSSHEEQSSALSDQAEKQIQPKVARQENIQYRDVIPPVMNEQVVVEDDLQLSMDAATDGIIVEENAEEYAVQPVAAAKAEAEKSKPVEKEEQTGSSLTEALQGKAAGVRQLDEVVVVGYGTQKKQGVTGSVSAVGNGMEQENSDVPKPVIGKRAYRKYLEENIVRPDEGECAGMKGKVKIRFSVDARGRPYNMQVQQKLCAAADREAMRLISEGSDWAPGNSTVTVTVEF